MPRYADVRHLLPADVARLVTVLGLNSARVAILIYLHDHPDATRTDLTRELDIGHRTVQDHLEELERTGVITGDLPEGSRRGRRPIRYRLHPDALLAELDHLRRRLS